MGLLLITPHEVVEIAFRGLEAMNESVIGEAPIVTAQYKFIRPVLGKLYEALLEGEYPELLNEYIKAPLAHYVKWLLLPRLSVQCGGIGVVQFKGENFSADIMLGLKGQTKEDVCKSIEVAALGGAKHISMYALTPEDGTPIYTDYLNGELPDGDEVAELYDFGRKLLRQKGYFRYEVSNFAQKGYESRHNLNYWRRGEYIGLGVSASSFFFGKRFTNTFDLDEYMKCILSGVFPVIESETVSEQDAKFEFVMLALRTVRGLSAREYRAAFHSDWKTDFSDGYAKTRKYFAESGDRTRIRGEYLYVQNQILAEYMN